jgi:hypothetical protein
MLQANLGRPISRGKRIFNEIFYLFDKAYIYVPGLSREGGRVWKMPEVRNWILTRVVANNQEETVMAAQIVTDLMQAEQFYNLAQTLDLAETICFIGYLTWAEGKGTKTPGRTVSAKVKGGGKLMTARVVLEPRTWADALTVLTTTDLRQFQSSDIRGRKTIQLQAGGELIILSVRIWIPMTSGRARGFWIVCDEQDSRTRRQIGTFGLATGPENEGGEPGPDALDEEEREVVIATIHEGGKTGEADIMGDDDEGEIASPASLDKEGEETEVLGDDDEEEEIMSPTVSELGTGEEELDDSLPAFTVLKRDGKAKLKKKIEDTLRVKLNTRETAELFE